MRFLSWLRTLDWGLGRQRPTRSRGPANRCRLALEALEDRVVPSTAPDFLYVGDGGNDNTVQRFDAATGAFVDTFVAGSKSLKGPRGLIFDQAGDLLLANQNAGRGKSGEIMRYDGAGAFDGELVSFQDPNAPFGPRGIVLKDGVLYVASLQEGDTDPHTGIAPNGRIARYDAATGAFLGDLAPPPGISGQFNPRGIVFGPDGKLYVSVFDSSNPAAGYILQFDLALGTASVFAANDGDGIAEPGETADLHRPEGLTFGPDGRLYVTSFRADAADTDKILIFHGTTEEDSIALDQVGQPRAFAQAIVFGPGGFLYVPVAGNGADTGAVRQYDVASKNFTNFLAPGTLKEPWYLIFGHTNSATLAYETTTADTTVAAGFSQFAAASAGGQRVTGHAVWDQTVGLPSGGMLLNQVSINAWLDANGQAHGTIVWTDVYNPLPGGGGQQVSGWPWVMRVDTLIIDGNTAHIAGVIITSPQSPEDVGVRRSWDVVDNGNGGGDMLDGYVLVSGDFSIH